LPIERSIVTHAVRRDIDSYRFMRWAEPRELGILAQYDQIRYEDIDRQVLSVHPVVRLWEVVMPYLLDMNKSYKRFYDNLYYHKIGKPSIPLAELFRGKPHLKHLQRLLKDKPYLKKGNSEAMEIISN